MLKKFLALSIISLLLSGCWVSKELLLSAKLAETPFEPGLYVNTEPKVGTTRYQLTFDGKGSYKVDDSKKLVLNRLRGTASKAGVYIYAHGEAGKWSYGLITVTTDGVYQTSPQCAPIFEEEIAIALRFGAEIKKGSEACTFSDENSLHQAMLRYYEFRGNTHARLFRKQN